MYRSITPKLFNTTTQSVKVKVRVVKPIAPSKPRKRERKPKKEERKPEKEKMKPEKEKKKPKKEEMEEERKPLQAKCPHLRPDKTCARMITEGLDGSVSDVDIKHFCKGNPLLCYYFRLPTPKK